MAGTYGILPIAELNNVNYSEVCDTCADEVRRSNDGTEFLIEWDGAKPASVNNLVTYGGRTEHTNQQLKDDVYTAAKWLITDPTA